MIPQDKDFLEKEIKRLKALHFDMKSKGSGYIKMGTPDTPEEKVISDQIKELQNQLYIPNVNSVEQAIELVEKNIDIDDITKNKCIQDLKICLRMEYLVGWEITKNLVCHFVGSAIRMTEDEKHNQRFFQRLASYSPGDRIVFSDQKWSELVRNTYGKKYHFQQQDGCKHNREYKEFTVPNQVLDDYNSKEKVIAGIDDEELGVNFQDWLSTTESELENFPINLEFFLIRNFYPKIEVIANDLYKKGLLEAGDYSIIVEL